MQRNGKKKQKKNQSKSQRIKNIKEVRQNEINYNRLSADYNEQGVEIIDTSVPTFLEQKTNRQIAILKRVKKNNSDENTG